ncbi:sporulation integral membrane protein YtvI [Sporosarcina sp. ANT_H38]|uniref:sporulation integral membrane protein YtvI n=1 Tax=Sporosarcina sp. ANT_H38 TaxID=2597358 RepID=UPI0011F16379|nr:sporulation integral membrane protein YtvI [Sporosarcina sp. ANT_H38]KAA0966631.1 sporulation integral membrane protein YtvI [Sporosarcina sp. ANT_H38]
MSKWLKKGNLIITISIFVIILVIIFILPVSLPIIFALLTAIIINPLVKLTEKKFKWNRQISVISVFILILAIITSLLYFTVTQLIGKIIDLTKVAPDYFNTLSGMWIDVQNKLLQYTSGMPEEVVIGIQKEFKNVFDSIRESILNLLSYDKIMSLMTEIPNFLVSFTVFIIALFLFMLELPELKRLLFRHLTTSTAEKARFMITRLNSVIFGFLKAQILVSLIVFVVTFIGLLLVIPKYAIVMSLVIWIIDIIPILGSIIILAPWSLYMFISGDIATGTQLAILAAVLMIIRRTVEPKLMGSQIGLSPLPTLIAMFIGLKLFGFIGFFIGPLAVILFTTAREAGIIKVNFRV